MHGPLSLVASQRAADFLPPGGMSGQICRQFGASAVAVEYGSAPMLMGPQRGWPGCLPAV